LRTRTSGMSNGIVTWAFDMLTFVFPAILPPDMGATTLIPNEPQFFMIELIV
jgi:hypothetical protein